MILVANKSPLVLFEDMRSNSQMVLSYEIDTK